MEDNAFWFRFWIVIGCMFATLVGTIGGCTMHGNAQVRAMVEKGANPIDARCAITNGTENLAVCAVRATAK